MEKKYLYNGKEYNLRKTSFKPYRVKAMSFIKSYLEFEKSFTEKLQTEINTFLFSNKKVQGRIIAANNSGDSNKLNKEITNILIENPEYALKAQELQNEKEYAKELFITSDIEGNPSEENAKKLCEIMFEKPETINHNPQTEEEYNKYIAFIYGVWTDFFLKFKK